MNIQMSKPKELIQKILKAKNAKEIALDPEAIELAKLMCFLFREIKSEIGKDEWSNVNMTSFTDPARYPIGAAFLRKGHHWMLILRFYSRTQNVLVYDSRFSEGKNLVLHKITKNEQIVITEVMWKYLKENNSRLFKSTRANSGRSYFNSGNASTNLDPLGAFNLLSKTNYNLNFGNSILARLQDDVNNCGPISIFAGIIANQETKPRSAFVELK